MQELKDILSAVLAEIESKYSRTVFELWFKDLRLLSLSETEAVLQTATNFKRNILHNRYRDMIGGILTGVLGFTVEIVFVSAEDEQGFTQPSFTPPEPPKKEEPPKPDLKAELENPSLVENYTFDNFIVGDSNRFAHAACLAVAKSPACLEDPNSPDHTYNPLFIYGQSGLGKTHLLYAITNEIKRSNPGLRIVYTKGEQFTNELITNISSGSTAAFRERYRSADVLLIDDIQFIAGKEATQEEFFHTFNLLYEENKQIILTSDRPPRDIKPLEDRLRSRFEWGLIADIQPPSFELRTAIIQKKAQDLHVTIPPESVDYLASQLKNNIRQIEGAIKKIAAISMLTGSPITMDMIKRSIADMLSGAMPSSVMIDRIFSEVSKFYGVDAAEMRGKKRHETILKPRQIAMYLMLQLTDLSLASVGEIFGRDHATVINARDKVNKLLSDSAQTASEVQELIRRIKS